MYQIYSTRVKKGQQTYLTNVFVEHFFSCWAIFYNFDMEGNIVILCFLSQVAEDQTSQKFIKSFSCAHK